MNNPVIGLTKEVISVAPTVIAFFCAMAILLNVYLVIPEGIAESFTDHAFNIVNGIPWISVGLIMFSSRMNMSVNYAIAIYSQLISLTIPLIGIAAGIAGIKLSYDAYIQAQGQLESQSRLMVNNVVSIVADRKDFEYTGGP